MGIRLDWEVNTSPGGRTVATEDPNQRRQRRTMRVRFIALLFGIAAGLGVVWAVIAWRLDDANAYIESLLRDTIEAEFAALRLGDRLAFDAIQRSATDDWLVYQSQVFDAFQNGKLAGTLELTGNVRDIEIDGTRGRAIVEWTDNGTPYSQAWFYWRYEEGWRRVPPDYTFWGRQQELRGQNVTVSYRDVDAALAEAVGLRVEGWIASTCGPILQCGDLPHITIDISADLYASWGWGSGTGNDWTFTVESPYIVGARSDQPFSGRTLETVANGIAQRLIGASQGSSGSFNLTTDAGYLIDATRTWLVGQFIGIDSGSTLIQSMADTSGRPSIGVLIRALTPESRLDSVLAAVNQTDVRAANLNWSHFFAYRLNLEAEYILTDPNQVYPLYDPAMVDRVTERTGSRAPIPDDIAVTTNDIIDGPDGAPTLIANVRMTFGDTVQQENVYFFWRDGTWLRGS